MEDEDASGRIRSGINKAICLCFYVWAEGGLGTQSVFSYCLSLSFTRACGYFSTDEAMAHKHQLQVQPMTQIMVICFGKKLILTAGASCLSSIMSESYLILLITGLQLTTQTDCSY